MNLPPSGGRATLDLSRRPISLRAVNVREGRRSRWHARLVKAIRAVLGQVAPTTRSSIARGSFEAVSRNSPRKNTYGRSNELITLFLTTALVGITGYYAQGDAQDAQDHAAAERSRHSEPYLTINVFSEPHVRTSSYLRIANTGIEQVQAMCALRWIASFYQLGEKHMPNLREASVFQQLDRATASRAC